MRYLLSLSLFILIMSSCRPDKDPVAANLNSATGTYEVTRLTQYQNGQKTFDGYLPYLLGDSTTIRHRIGVSLGDLKPDGTANALIIRNLYRTGKFPVNHAVNIGGLNMTAKNVVEFVSVDFYRDGVNKIGSYRNQTLSFDIVEPDSLNQPVRYVFEAKKVSDTANRF